MSRSTNSTIAAFDDKKYKGVRRRKWGKWVSEIRVPGTQERLWLGSYSTPKAAAMAHDIASYCLRGPSSIDSLNFPLTLPASVRANMSPKSIQKAASDAGMAIDAQMILDKNLPVENEVRQLVNEIQGLQEMEFWEGCQDWQGNEARGEGLSISTEDYVMSR